MSIQVKQKAPNFAAEAVVKGEFKKISLSDYEGKWVVLFFYPLDFTFVCPTEITAFSDAIEQFHGLNAEILGASVDSKFSHLAWINTPRNKGGLGELRYPLIADINKSISRSYGVLLENDGVALRGLFLIDPKGNLRYQVVHDLGVGRSVDETLRVLKAFQHVDETGEVCPAGWTQGGDTIRPEPTASQSYFSKRT
jgi:alkyl hydroperoxide reductase subunit AhpC